MKQPTFLQSCKVFGSTFVLTLCLMMAGIGFLLVDYNTSRISSGGSVSARYESRGARLLHSMDEQMQVIPEKDRELVAQLWSAIPARWRVGGWMVQGERELAAQVIGQPREEAEAVSP